MHHKKYVEHCYSWNAYGASNYENHAMYGMHQNLLIEAKVSRCFDEMVAIVSVGVDLDDSTTNV